MVPTLPHDLTSLGWDDGFADSFTVYADACTPARISRVDRGAVDALTGEHVVRAAIRHDTDVTVGDWVAIADKPLHVAAVLPRRSAFVRGNVAGTSQHQALAANIDTVFVVVPMMKAARLGLIERFVALGWESGATPVVVLTKSDLVDDPELVRAQTAATTPGADVHAVSVVTGEGLEILETYASRGRSVALLGQSGVGKSSLVNALTGAEVMATGAIRLDGKGRHTTTHRELVVVPDGGVLIDTPGLRGLALVDADEGIDRAYADVEDLATRCRFNDCAHASEPGCAVLAAVGDGSLPKRRLDGWRKLRREAEWMAARTDARLRAERARRWKLIHAEVRRSGNARS